MWKTVLLGVVAPLLGLAGPAPDVRDLVARLGAPRYADREAAAEAILALGREALPALREARDAEDPEVRSRVEAILLEIEVGLMLQPTRVRVDFASRPLREVVEDLGRQGAVPVALEAATRESHGGRRLTLRDPEPLAFWEAIDRVCREAGLHAGFGLREGPDGRPAQGLLLYDARGRRPAPVFDSGPFRVKLIGSHFQRNQLFEPEPGDPEVPMSSDQCQLQLLVMAEPRLRLAQRGTIRLSEARDDRGQSLLPPSPLAESGLDPPNIFAFAGGASLQASVDLRRPEQPGRRIASLKGTIPLALAARRPGPLEVPLPVSIGRTYVGDDVALVVHALRTDPNDPQLTLELTIRPPTTAESSPRRSRTNGSAASLAPEFLEHQVEVEDRGGRPYVIFPLEVRPQGESCRLTLLLAPTDGAAGPARLRFYGLTRTTTDLPFEFSDVPMP